MKVIKQILKLLGGFAAGICAGLLIAAVCIVAFTDMTLAEYLAKFRTLEISEGLIAAGAGIAALLVAVPALVLIHEGGHLAGGLLSGYRFVSFRVFNLTFIRLDGKLRIKRYAVAGTGGQCLMCPPDLPSDRVPVTLYNMGGVLANLLVMFVAVPFFFTDIPALGATVLTVFCLVDLIMILTNGIPMRLGGIGNDAHNGLSMRHNAVARHAMTVQLRSNAMVQAGVRPKDMPAEWFAGIGHIDYSNPLEVSLTLMAASRLVDMNRWEEADAEFGQLYDRRDSLIGIYVMETACELLFTSLVTGRTGRASELMADKELMKYIDRYSGVMSSKLRIKFTVSLLAEGDRKGAVAIYERLYAARESYLLQGEVMSDLAIMRQLLGDGGAAQSS